MTSTQHLCARMVKSLILVLFTAACTQAPPGNWQGRCDTKRDRSAQVAGIDLSDWHGAPSSGSIQPTAVLDRAGLFDASTTARLANDLDVFQRATCHRFVAVTTPTLRGQPIEDYSLALANQLVPGHKGLNNGLMILIAPNERSVRIEVGCGLEDVISDEQADAIMKAKIVPACRTGDFARAASDGLHALMALARAKHVPEGWRPPICVGAGR